MCSYVLCGFRPTSTSNVSAVSEETRDLFFPVILSWQRNTVSDKQEFIFQDKSVGVVSVSFIEKSLQKIGFQIHKSYHFLKPH